MKELVFVIMILTVLLNFNPAYGQKPPSVFSAADIEENWGKNCLIYGKYTTLMLPKNARPGSPKIPSGRIVIMLSDTSALALETHDAGFRSDAEIKKFIDCKVVVEGTLQKYMQLWGKPGETAIVMSAITNIKNIEIIDCK